jgi:hypothetical protein
LPAPDLLSLAAPPVVVPALSTCVARVVTFGFWPCFPLSPNFIGVAVVPVVLGAGGATSKTAWVDDRAWTFMKSTMSSSLGNFP